MINLNQLEAFLILADCLNLTETAHRMHCSQPAMSQKIRTLEQCMGVILFDRIGKRMYLTHQGKAFRPYAAQAVNTIKTAREHLQSMSNPTKGSISFGASNYVGVYLIPSLLSSYKQRAPELSFSINISNSHQLLNLLESNEVEFLLLSDHIKLDSERYIYADFYCDQMVLVVYPDHRFSLSGYCQLGDLLDETFLTKPEGSATRTFIFEKLHSVGQKLNKLMSISSLEGIKQGVIHKLGISIISRLAVIQEIERGTLVEIEITDMKFERKIRIVRHFDKQQSPAALSFIAALQDVK
ncbi:LysR family transcriptional regulator [Aeromonas hydrophila]|uniref:LysR substrate-binding domain-containing protein n=1 Tax=Aeromonas hydrophila TaxID=644 RepID=UPI00191E1D1F|nr:LysR substrate-binding domain-containing protein [Aeromonas hydrophila]MBL0573290.1 LysR family transcriptional regulator [Aeromonas hydrophila]